MLSKEIMEFMYEATDRDDISIYGIVGNYLVNKRGYEEDTDELYDARDEIVERILDSIKITLDEGES